MTVGSGFPYSLSEVDDDVETAETETNTCECIPEIEVSTAAHAMRAQEGDWHHRGDKANRRSLPWVKHSDAHICGCGT